MARETTIGGSTTSRNGLLNVGSTTRREGVMVEIKRGIVRGQLQPGQKLTEAALSESLGVSRPTVREALNQLCQEGLLVQEPYRGLRVASMDSQAIIDIAEARVAIDLQAIKAILDDESAVRMAAVEEAWSQFEVLAFAEDPVVQHDAHVNFHRRLWAASENYLLNKLWPVTEAHLTIALAQDQSTRLDPQRAYDIHLRIVEAIRTRDMRKIRNALEAHTIESAYELVEIISAT